MPLAGCRCHKIKGPATCLQIVRTRPQAAWRFFAAAARRWWTGPHAARDEARLARQHRLTLIQATYGHGIAFSDETAHHYGLLCGRLKQHSRNPRGRAMDLMIAATALSLGVVLVTRNPADVDSLGVELLIR